MTIHDYYEISSILRIHNIMILHSIYKTNSLFRIADNVFISFARLKTAKEKLFLRNNWTQ